MPLQQHPNFATALAACGQSPLVLPGSPPLIILRRRFRPGLRIAMISRATVSTNTNLKQVNLHRTPLIISPDGPDPSLRRLGAVPLMTPATLAEINLRPSVEQRRVTLHQKWRNRLKHAEFSNLRVARTPLPDDPDHWVLSADQTQQQQRKYRNWPIALTLAYTRTNPGQAVIFTAFDGRDPVAAMLFLRHGATATYHIGHTTPRGRKTCAHNLLLWQASNWLARQGHHRLDLGLINTNDTPGLARFKLGSGATLRQLGGTWLWWPPLGRALAPLSALDRRAMTIPERTSALV